MTEIAEHNARWRNAALAKGYDSIVLMSPKGFSEFRASGKLLRSIELNILEPTLASTPSTHFLSLIEPR